MKKISLDEIEFDIEGSTLETLVRIGDIYLGSELRSDADIDYIRKLAVQSFIDFGPMGITSEEIIEKDGGRYFHCPITDVSNIDNMFLQGVDQLLNSEVGPVLIYGKNLSHIVSWLTLHLCLVERRELSSVLGEIKKLSFFEESDLEEVSAIIKRENDSNTICL